jgi:putative membrane protein
MIYQINFAIQTALMLGLGYSYYLSSRKKMKLHCLVLRVLTGVLFFSILVVMTPVLLNIEPENLLDIRVIETMLHHTLGLVVLIIFVFVNLVSTGVIKYRRRLRDSMRVATYCWVATYVIGLHMYLFMFYGIL